jgi:hypothetical protein
MKIRTLAEAAADILNQTRASAPADQPQSYGQEIDDLGGSTTEEPDGGNVGQMAAAKIGQAPQPQPQGKATDVPVSEEEEWVDSYISEEADEDEDEDEKDEDEKDEMKESAKIDELNRKTYVSYLEKRMAQKGKSHQKIKTSNIERAARKIAAAKKTEKNNMEEQHIIDILKSFGIQEDIDALFNGEDLSEDFRKKAASIFEAAVVSRAVVVIEALEEEIINAASETVEEIKEELEGQIDNYMNYVVEDWKESNKLAIETGIRLEIQEEFIDGLKKLFVENYIDIPYDKVDVVENLNSQVEELKAKLDEAINVNIEMNALIEHSLKNEIIHSVCEGLTATQAEKMKSLAEGVEFTAEGEYREKLEILKENYFSRKVKSQQTNLLESHQTIASEEEKVIPSSMQYYVDAISRTLKK